MILLVIRLKEIIKVIAATIVATLLDVMIMAFAVVYGITLLNDWDIEMLIVESVISATLMIGIAVFFIKLLGPKRR